MFASTATGTPFLTIANTGIYVTSFGTSTPTNVLTISTSTVTNAWFNYALVKHGSTLSYYVNGNVVGVTTATSIATLATPAYVGLVEYLCKRRS